MESSEEGTLDIDVTKMKKVVGPVNGEIKTKFHKEAKRLVVDVGNTRFKVTFDTGDDGVVNSHFDYTPEGSWGGTKGNEAKYASIFGFSLLKIRSWVNEESKLNKFGIKKKQLDKLTALTNPKMSDAIKNLFDRHNHGDLVTTKPVEVENAIDPYSKVSIDWQGFLNLDNKDKLITTLEGLSKRASKTEVKYWIPQDTNAN